MTEAQERKISNLITEIRKTEAKIDKLLTHRAMLADQIQRIQESVPKEVQKPSIEQRQAQSRKDKAAHAERAKEFRSTIKRMELK